MHASFALVAAALLLSLGVAPAAAGSGETNGLQTVFYYRPFKGNGDQTYLSRFTETPFDARITPVLDLRWGDSAPDKRSITNDYPGLKYSFFLSMRWVGSVAAPVDGAYVFRLASYPGSRLMIDGQLCVDALYGRNGVYYDTAPLEFRAGERHDLAVEHWSWVGGAIRLMWRKPGDAEFSVIPTARLFPGPAPVAAAAPPAAAPRMDPDGGRFDACRFVSLSADPGGSIRYTLDGSEPTWDRALFYRVPIALTNSATIKARVFRRGAAPSAVVAREFVLQRPPLKPGLKLFRTGNSLTVNSAMYLPQIMDSAGYALDVHPIILAGSPTRLLWEKFGVDTAEAGEKRNARTLVAAQAPFDYYITQPFAESDLARETDFTSRFYDLVLEKSPGTDLFIYMQWPYWNRPVEFPEDRRSDRTMTSQQWLESLDPYVKWFEDLREQLQLKYPERRVRIIPAGLAFRRLLQEMEAKRVPGLTDFAYQIMGDGIHAGHRGCYLIGLVHFACLQKQSPVGLVVPDTELTPEQQLIFQQIAWETARDYRWSGVAEGSGAAGK